MHRWFQLYPILHAQNFFWLWKWPSKLKSHFFRGSFSQPTSNIKWVGEPDYSAVYGYNNMVLLIFGESLFNIWSEQWYWMEWSVCLCWTPKLGLGLCNLFKLEGGDMEGSERKSRSSKWGTFGTCGNSREMIRCIEWIRVPWPQKIRHLLPTEWNEDSTVKYMNLVEDQR